MSKNKKIMILDDDADFAETLANLVEARFGFSVDCFHEPDNALYAALEGGYDVVISDIVMPGMDGIQFLEQLRSNLGYVPVVLMSGQGDRERLRAALKLHAFDFIEKPVLHEELFRCIENALSFNKEKKIQEIALNKLTTNLEHARVHIAELQADNVKYRKLLKNITDDPAMDPIYKVASSLATEINEAIASLRGMADTLSARVSQVLLNMRQMTEITDKLDVTFEGIVETLSSIRFLGQNTVSEAIMEVDLRELVTSLLSRSQNLLKNEGVEVEVGGVSEAVLCRCRVGALFQGLQFILFRVVEELKTLPTHERHLNIAISGSTGAHAQIIFQYPTTGCCHKYAASTSIIDNCLAKEGSSFGVEDDGVHCRGLLNIKRQDEITGFLKASA